MKEWYVRRSGGIAGPFSEGRLRKLLAEGMVEPGTRVRRGEDGEWQSVASVIAIGASKQQNAAGSTSDDNATGLDPVLRRRMLIAGAGVALSALIIVAFVLGRGSREADVVSTPAPAPAPTPFAPPQPAPATQANVPVAATPKAVKPAAVVDQPKPAAPSKPFAGKDVAAVNKPGSIAQVVTRPAVVEQPAQPAPVEKPDEPKEVKDTELTRIIERLGLELTPEAGLNRLAENRMQLALTSKQESKLAAEEARWNERKEKGLVRLGNRWVKPEVQKAAEKKATKLVNQATPLLKVGSFKEAITFLEEASDANGNAVEADFKLGLLRSFDWATPLIDADEAEKHFEEVLKRSPDNVPALNNAAIAELKQKKYPQAVQHLSHAAMLAPRCQEVAQNLGRALFLGGQKRIHLSADDERALAEVYATLIAEGKGKEANIAKGYQLMPMLLPKEEREKKDPEADRGKDLILTATGSGFAVGPKLILTNRHVVDDTFLGVADEIRVAVSKKDQPVKRLKGGVVALCDHADLALVMIEGLDAKPLVLRAADSRLAEEVAIVGFPLPNALGDDLKFTKGSISAVQPDTLLFDCVANQGNSGGPVLSTGGEVVSIYTFVRFAGNAVRTRHGGGVPSTIARRFVQDHLPQLPAEAGQGGKDWPTLIEDVRDSIFKVEVYHNAGSPALLAASARVKREVSPFEDRTCPTCGGRAALPCPGKCVKGGFQRTVIDQQPGSVLGRDVMVPRVSSRVDVCDVCRGRGAVDCPLCVRGIDTALGR
ncbi:hypothetical protein AYO47_05165 [Planctomyces sp. SCGC AG-212-M04]|nr:hypothetical protein AYO47_05165 [Planctomyces sp. SCGC AG-212-M04]